MATIKDRIDSILSAVAEIQNHAGDERLNTFTHQFEMVDSALSSIVDSLGECGTAYEKVYSRELGRFFDKTCARKKKHDGDHDELGD